MKRILFLITILSSVQLNAQTYLVSFAGIGASNSVDSVKVENLPSGNYIAISGDDILRLTGTVGITSYKYNQNAGIKLYPNPSSRFCSFEITAPVDGESTFSIFDIGGKLMFRSRKYLDTSTRKFALTGLGNGCFIIAVSGNGYKFSGRLISTGQAPGKVNIDEVSSTYQSVSKKSVGIQTAAKQNIVDMVYASGDRLKLTGFSGLYRTVVTEAPVSDTIVSFMFIDCTDADANSYSVVGIGSQIWMAENLKATKYSNGAEISNVTDNFEWSSLISPAYCWYNNDTVFKNIYGALYNWYAVNTGNLCPIGWHFPTSTEWADLITNLGGSSVAAVHMKETGNTHWAYQNMADDSCGFSVLPGGVRMDTYLPWIQKGIFEQINRSAWYTASDEAGEQYAYWLELTNDSKWATLQNSYPKNTGFSVRCIMNK